jgi:hypothetical protein
LAAVGKRGLDMACDLKDRLGGQMVSPGHGSASGGAMLSRKELKSRMFE